MMLAFIVVVVVQLQSAAGQPSRQPVEVHVLGAGIREPGTVLLERPTVINAIFEAGWFTIDAGPEVHVRRARADVTGPVLDGAPDVRVSRSDVESGAAKVTLGPGDTVYVPRPETFVISGEVKRFGEYALSFGLTLREALWGLAGGVTAYGAENRIYVIRKVKGKAVEIKVPRKLLGDFLIQPNDIVVVPRKWFSPEPARRPSPHVDAVAGGTAAPPRSRACWPSAVRRSSPPVRLCFAARVA